MNIVFLILYTVFLPSDKFSFDYATLEEHILKIKYGKHVNSNFHLVKFNTKAKHVYLVLNKKK